ncbi:MAG: hypothetical protein QXM16_06350 [Nitrososphaerota archaeon]
MTSGVSPGWQGALRYMFAGVLTFVASLTIGNTPYLFFGYGISFLGLLTTGLLLNPLPAVVVVFVSTTAAMSLIALTRSAFTLVVVAFVLLRTVQVYILSRLKRRMGVAGASLMTVLIGTVTATLLGLAYYGEGAISVSMTFFESVFIFPAYVLVRVIGLGRWWSLFLGGATLFSTFGIFFSASLFWIPLSTAVSIIVLMASSFLILRGKASRIISAALLAFALLAIPASFSSDTTSFSYNMRNTFYPLYPDSLSASQWVQTNSSRSCMQGNIAGAGTVESGVWGPERLRVLNTCVTISGIVEGLAPTYGPAYDGDFIIDVRPDPQYQHMLSIGSLILRDGLMHVEVVPSQQPTLANTLSSLKPGDRVIVTGAFVIDTDHGYWSEIHPTWAISIIPSA